MTYISRLKGLLGMSLAVFLAACGGGGSGGGGNGGGTPAPVDARPIAQATVSPGSRVPVGSEVTFDGSGSTAAAGSLSYQWSLLQQPDGGTATLSTTNAARTALVPDRAGVWTLSLVVSNGTASSNPVHVSVTAAEPARPLAVIRPLNSGLVGLQVQLDGSDSLPPEGGNAAALRHEWELVAAPDGSVAAIDDPTNRWPRFTPDVEGSYRVRLTVHYEDLVSDPVEQSIDAFVQTAPPTAVARLLTENPLRGQVVQLDGTESIDPTGAELNYFWSFGSTSGQPYPNHGRPRGSNVVIDNPHSATPTFTPDMVGTYRFMLMVWSDKRVGIGAVNVTVGKPDGEPNTAPVAEITPYYYSYSFEQEPGIGSSLRVTLGDGSWDVDGDTLTKEWTLLSHPPGFDRDASFSSDSWSTGFQPTHPGQYVAQLRVFDGTEWSQAVTQVYTVRTGANMGPVARVKTAVGANTSSLGGAMVRSTTLVGDTVTLDGTASEGGNNDEVFYQWELAYKPPGSQAALDEFRATHPRFVADREGPYLVRLRVRDADGLWARNQAEILIVAKTANSAPLMRPTIGAIHHPDGVRADQPMLLDGVSNRRFSIATQALDPDGDQVDVLATLIDAPAGFQWPEVRQWSSYRNGWEFDSVFAGFIGLAPANAALIDVSGTYVFELIGSDGMDRTERHVVSLPVSTMAEYPGLLLRAGALDATGTDFRRGEADFHHPLGTTRYPVIFTNTPWDTLPDDPNTGYVDGVHELRAPVGQSFTIVDLRAESDDPTVPVRFVGLTEGQVIQPGTPVRFHLGVQRFPQDRIEDRPETPYPLARWSFRVQERPEWTFHVQVPLRGQWER